jgi:hypothetical protein
MKMSPEILCITAVPANGPVKDKVLPTRMGLAWACTQVPVVDSNKDEPRDFKKGRFCMVDSSDHVWMKHTKLSKLIM